MSGTAVQMAKAESKMAWMNMRNRDRYFLNAAIIVTVAGAACLATDMYFFDNEEARVAAVHQRYDYVADPGPDYVAPSSGWDTFIKITTWCAIAWIANFVLYWAFTRGRVANARWCSKQDMMDDVSLGGIRFLIIFHTVVSFIISVFAFIVMIHGVIQTYKPVSLKVDVPSDQLAYNYLIILWVGAMLSFIGYFTSAVLYAIHSFNITAVCRDANGKYRPSSKAMMGSSRMSRGMRYSAQHMH